MKQYKHVIINGESYIEETPNDKFIESTLGYPVYNRILWQGPELKDGEVLEDSQIEKGWQVRSARPNHHWTDTSENHIQHYKQARGWSIRQVARPNTYCNKCKDIGCIDCDIEARKAEVKPKYPIGGYAPGNYSCICANCKSEFTGDKRAVQCEPCAVRLVKAEAIEPISPNGEKGNKAEVSEEKPDKDYLKSLGFKELPHFTVTDSLILDLGRYRHLSIGCLGTPNEMMFICQKESENSKKITDLICLHNWDYDGYLTNSKINLIVSALITQPK